jgi:hypothetical protein
VRALRVRLVISARPVGERQNHGSGPGPGRVECVPARRMQKASQPPRAHETWSDLNGATGMSDFERTLWRLRGSSLVSDWLRAQRGLRDRSHRRLHLPRLVGRCRPNQWSVPLSSRARPTSAACSGPPLRRAGVVSTVLTLPDPGPEPLPPASMAEPGALPGSDPGITVGRSGRRSSARREYPR